MKSEDISQRSADQALVRIRRAAIDDLETVFEINRRSATAGFRHIFGDVPFPSARVRDRFCGLLESGEHTVLVAEISEEPVGFVVVSTGVLDALYVVPESWGAGVGTRLADEAEALLGGGEAILWVLRDNARGRRFWECRGWRPDGAEMEMLGKIELRYRRASSAASWNANL